MKQGIVLFGHGSRNAEWAVPFHEIRREIRSRQPQIEVELAFLELMGPSLPEAIASLAAAGVSDVTVVPVFISAGNHVREDLPRLAAEATASRPGVRVRIAPALGEAAEVIAAMAAY